MAAALWGAGPVSADEDDGKSFSSQWADAAWSGHKGRSASWQVTMAPGQDSHGGRVTEYLKTAITASYCDDGYIYEAKLAKNEQARNLQGVSVQAGHGRAAVSRRTRLPGTLTKTASSDCVTASGEPTVTNVNPKVVLRGSWRSRGNVVRYSGEDCGGTGRCTYFDARARGSVTFLGETFSMGHTSGAWLWRGSWGPSA